MAEIKFYANIEGIAASGDPSLINHGAASGLGFYGAGFGVSVPVDQYQDSTFITNSAGTAEGSKLNNTKYASVSGVSHNGGAEIDNETMPNYYAPLNIRFTHTEDVRVQNCKLRIFDRSDISRQASGVTTKVYEVRHPDPSAATGVALSAAARGEGTHDWKEYDSTLGDGGMFDTKFSDSPGVSGTNSINLDAGKPFVLTALGNAHTSSRHDWYVALSASPQSIGSKTDFGLYFTCEYL